MKRISLFALVFIAAFATSCHKENAVDASSTSGKSIEDVSTIIVGTWQLKDIGTSTVVSSNYNESSPKMGCGMMGASVSWSTTADEIKLNFASSGDYTKYLNTKISCKGSFNYTNSDIYIQANCNEGGHFGIHEFAKKELVLGDGLKLYRYAKVDKN